ncbi:MAG: methyl-accepting chemotaxis protein [Eubacterium sp.]|nr:methyl-accepting chemotaxis protein [Eubacterium sp.]
MKKLLNMKKKEQPIHTPTEKKPKAEKQKSKKIKTVKKEKPKKEARMPKIKREKPKRKPKNPSVKKLPKPVSVVWEWLKWLGRQILKLIRIIPTLFPKKSEKDAPLLDGNVKVLPQFCIQTKLIGCYLIPVMLIVILGIVSYSRSSGALNSNYEAAVSQTMNMANEYFTFALSNIESDMNTVLSDSELSTYYSGEYSTNDAQQKTRDDLKKKYDALQEKINSLTPGTTAYYKTYYDYATIKDEFEEADEILTDASDGKTNVYDSFNQSISNKVAANQFIGNIYIVKGGYNTFSSQSKLRGQEDKTKEDVEAKRDIHAKGEEIYSAFLDTDLGQKVSMDATSYYWVGSGSMPDLDKLLLVDPSSYILRVAHDVSSTTDAVMIVDIKKDAILDILTNFNLGEGSYVGIITPDNQEMVVEGKDITKEEEGKSKSQNSIVKETIYKDQDFYKDALKSEKDSGKDYVRFDGKTYLFTFEKIGRSGIMLCSMVPQSVIVAQANSIRVLTFVMVVISCIIAMIVGTLISKGFSKSINLSIKELAKVSKGDLTVEFRTNRRDEFALLYGSCNDMLANIRGLIMEVESVYDALSVSLNKVNTSSTTFSETTKDIQTSVHEIETGVGEQTESATDCLNEMDSLFTKINVVNDNTNEIGSIAASTQVAINSGLTSMDNLNAKTKSTTDITDSVIQTIKELSVHSKNIGQIVNSINDIAEETNLLSLNASIEAARAGAAGKGFSVVATQIRKLADQCLASAGKISNIVTEITEATKEAVSTAQTAEEIVDEQVEAVAATAHSFQTLKQRIEKLSEYLESIQSSSKDMEASGSSTLNSMENISAILEETLASVTSVANVTDKQSEALTSLDDASSQLMIRAERLGDAISKFKTK